MINRKVFKLVFFTFITSTLFACSSITTIMEPEKKDADGIPYFMPKKDFIVTVVVATEGKTVTSSVSPAYPDLSKQFIINYNYNLFGDNKLVVGVSKKGLLTSINSTTISQVNGIFKGIAKSAGYITALGIVENPPTTDCSITGTYIFKFRKPITNERICGEELTVSITKDEGVNKLVHHDKKNKKGYSGIFYRQDIPYTIDVTGSGIINSTIVFSPSESPIYFLPISKSFFADNDAIIVLTDGSITSYTQDNKSEILALATLPADILQAYFSAITSAFTTSSSSNTAESTALSNSLKLDLAKMKYKLCIAAIKNNNDEQIKQLECSK